MKKICIIFLVIFSVLPAITHLHLVEKDFLEIMASSDGLWIKKTYCFMQISKYVGIEKLTGVQGRPPLVAIWLSIAYKIWGHNLLAIYLTYFLPRLLIAPIVYLITKKYFSSSVSYLTATLPFFFPFFETYAVSTLKADVFVVAWTLWATFFYLRWISTHKNRDLTLTSAILSLNVLSKETAIGISLAIWLALAFSLRKDKHKSHKLWLILLPPLLLIGPFVIFSLSTVGRPFPSLFATALSVPSLPTNLLTYVLSVFYYAGVDFYSGKYIASISLIKIVLLLTGLWAIIRKRLYVLVLPIILMIVLISFMDTRVVQGNIVGNRELLHRIAPVVPFLSIYIAFGTKKALQFVFRKKSKHISLLTFIFMLLFSLILINHYFSAPYALDYTDKEFYVNASTVFKYHPEIPVTRFIEKNNLCIINQTTAGRFLLDYYRPFKTSAFPKWYKELLITLWLLPLAVILINQKVTKNSNTK